MLALCRRIAGSTRFDAAMLVVITANAVVLGLQTFHGIDRDHGRLLEGLNDAFLAMFTVELAIRVAANWPKPADFLKSGWNVFDFVVVTASYLPGLRENATLLRMLRLARIVRAVRFLPDLRIIAGAVARSIPGVSSLAVMTLLLVYLYGMAGWLIFDEHDPEAFGNVGEAMITMFVLLTLENLPDYIERGQELSQWTIAFYVSYVLVAAFLVFNLFIGIVINSMEEAQQEEHRLRRLAERDAAQDSEDPIDNLVVAAEDRIDELREALEALEAELQLRARRVGEGR